MRPVCIAIFALFMAFPCRIEAMVVPADTTNSVHFDKPLLTLFHHIRLAQLKSADNEISLYWNYTDSANHTRADFTIPMAAESIDYAVPMEVDVIQRTQGRDSLISRTKVDLKTETPAKEGVSVILSLRRNGQAALLTGSNHATATIEVPFDYENPANTLIATARETSVSDNFLLTEYRAPVQIASIGSSETLKDYLRNSNDPYEGLWSYLDRNTDPSLTAVSRAYILATVKNADGDYEIIYVNGTNKGWEPMQIKGKLHKTVFTDHFDLEWIAADRTTLKDDTSATIEGNGNILRLYFPLVKASVRFRKVRRSEI